MKSETLVIKGLKCDNPNCDYKDDSISFSEYEKHVNSKCPKCGMVLLTEKEYLACLFLDDIAKSAQRIFKDSGDMKSVKISIIDKERFDNVK